MEIFDYLNEEWKDVKGYEGYYQVSNYGRVRSLDRVIDSRKYKGKLKCIKYSKFGYCIVSLYKNCTPKYYLIHRLVAEAFIPNINNYPQINHINEIKTDNRVENLEWCDSSYNINFGNRTKIAAEKKSKKVLQYKNSGEFVKEWESLTSIGKVLGYNIRNISSCCLHKCGFKTAYGYKWEYK